jgi:hypothetical protein
MCWRTRKVLAHVLQMFDIRGEFLVSELSTIAQTIGVNDLSNFSDCLNNKTYLNEIKKDFFLMVNILKLSGTPTWYINGN